VNFLYFVSPVDAPNADLWEVTMKMHAV